jgi:hypothetical protein
MRALFWLGLAFALAPALAVAEESFLLERDKLDIAPHAGVEIRSIEVDNRLGDVTVLGWDEPTVSLSVQKRAPDGETLERLKVNLTPDPGGALRVASALLFGREARPIPAGTVRIDVTLSVPRGAHLDVKAWNGKLSVTGLRAGARLTAHEAEVTVTDVDGPVAITNTRGRQRLSEVEGTVTSAATFGDLLFDDVGGDSLAASVHEGSVTATRIRSRMVRIRTTFGHIVFQGELLAGGRVDLGSYRGDVRVRFRRGALVMVDARSRQGAVDSQIELADIGRPETNRLRGTFGPPLRKPALLQVSSIVGNVSLGLMNE